MQRKIYKHKDKIIKKYCDFSYFNNIEDQIIIGTMGNHLKQDVIEMNGQDKTGEGIKREKYECALEIDKKCKKFFTEKNEEHILPSAIGGRKKVTGFICKSCNNTSGHKWDSPLVNSLKG